MNGSEWLFKKGGWARLKLTLMQATFVKVRRHLCLGREVRKTGMAQRTRVQFWLLFWIIVLDSIWRNKQSIIINQFCFFPPHLLYFGCFDWGQMSEVAGMTWCLWPLLKESRSQSERRLWPAKHTLWHHLESHRKDYYFTVSVRMCWMGVVMAMRYWRHKVTTLSTLKKIKKHNQPNS